VKILVNEDIRTGQSRVTFVRLLSLQLRLMELWREAAGGHQEALVQMAVGAINGDRMTRGAHEERFRSIENALPRSLMTKCNLSSIASATGLNRETVRRVINRLIEAGPLVRSSDGSINFVEGWSQGPATQQLGNAQLDEFARTANLLLRDGVLSAQD
jgi:hypothetical protein